MIKDFRFVGDDFANVQDITQPDCVPSLQTIVNRALAGVGTGLGQSIFDESDTDFNMMDRLDREAMRQDTERRIAISEQEESPVSENQGVVKDDAAPSVSGGDGSSEVNTSLK